MTTGKVKFEATFTFEIEPEIATAILAANTPGRHLLNWLRDDGAMTADHSSYDSICAKDPEQSNDAVKNLFAALGKHWASQKIEERRLLSAPTGEAVPMEQSA